MDSGCSSQGGAVEIVALRAERGPLSEIVRERDNLAKIRDEIERPGKSGPEWIAYSLFRRLANSLNRCRTPVEDDDIPNHINWLKKLQNDK